MSIFFLFYYMNKYKNDDYTNESHYKYALHVEANENECGQQGLYYNAGEPITTMYITSL